MASTFSNWCLASPGVGVLKSEISYPSLSSLGVEVFNYIPVQMSRAPRNLHFVYIPGDLLMGIAILHDLSLDSGSHRYTDQQVLLVFSSGQQAGPRDSELSLLPMFL